MLHLSASIAEQLQEGRAIKCEYGMPRLSVPRTCEWYPNFVTRMTHTLAQVQSAVLLITCANLTSPDNLSPTKAPFWARGFNFLGRIPRNCGPLGYLLLTINFTTIYIEETGDRVRAFRENNENSQALRFLH